MYDSYIELLQSWQRQDYQYDYDEMMMVLNRAQDSITIRGKQSYQHHDQTRMLFDIPKYWWSTF
jgi:hypothetical protein